MTAAMILDIIRLSLQLAVATVESMTPEQRTAFLERHEQRMQFWDKLLDKVKDRDA